MRCLLFLGLSCSVAMGASSNPTVYEYEVHNCTTTNVALVQSNLGYWFPVGSAPMRAWLGTGDVTVRVWGPGWPPPGSNAYAGQVIYEGGRLVIRTTDAGTSWLVDSWPKNDVERGFEMSRLWTWYSSGFGVALGMVAVGWGFRMVRATVNGGDAEP